MIIEYGYVGFGNTVLGNLTKKNCFSTRKELKERLEKDKFSFKGRIKEMGQSLDCDTMQKITYFDIEDNASCLTAGGNNIIKQGKIWTTDCRR